MTIIELNGSSPPTDQVYQGLRSLILAGRLVAGEKLPSVRQVARDLVLAPGTVAKAYKQLEIDGLVVSRAGAGTRVSDTSIGYPAEVLLAARRLVEAGTNGGLSLDESISALRAIWMSGEEPNEL